MLRTRSLLPVVAAAIGLVVGLAQAAPVAAACSGAPVPEEGTTLEQKAEAIFTGTAVRVDDPRSALDVMSSPDDAMTWTFAVDGVEKGDVGERFSIVTPRSDDACGFAFQLGSRYRVLAWGSSAGHLKVVWGNGTQQVADLPSPPPVEGRHPALLPDLVVYAWLAAVALLVVGPLVRARRLRPAPPAPPAAPEPQPH